MIGTNDIRKTFLDYFASSDHAVVASAPLVPMNDPTLLFTNAGMVPFKNLFTGAETRDYVRAASSQKCVRAGGKHNDLDNVGYTARHHTFFEMLGNFSFGDYFKEEAIYHAWTLLTKDYGLNKDKLCVTVYHEDQEAYDLWKKIAGLDDADIIRINTDDNFWSMGDTGPCGPCSEIFYDHGDHIWGGRPGTPEEDGDRFVEIWNLVFMQFEQLPDGSRINLPKPSIDTGMGLERISSVMQGTHNNYETDQFVRLIEATEAAISLKTDDKTIGSFRVIADHLRSCSFLIADGVLPANEGRGYVLRRIMRRAMRHAHMLGAKDLVMHQLVPALISEMGAAYSDLSRAEALITETLKLEESRFQSMLDKGMKLLDTALNDSADDSPLPGDVAFKLYDTYGFPLDLTQDALRAQNRSVDVDGFNTAMDAQKAKARAAWSGSGDAGTEKLWFDLKDQHGMTEFLGYTSTEAEAVVQAIVMDGAEVKAATAGDTISLLVNQTPFYGESGGQMGDTGLIKSDSFEMQVTNTGKAVGDLHVHMGTVISGTINTGDTVELKVNNDRRLKLRANHSATHILHEVLRRHLGDHVAQKGSLVAEDRLRFDIAHPKAIETDEISAVEAEVNAIIRGNSAVDTHLMSYDHALEAGAMALFGEKYGDEVRVVSMGDLGANNKAFSVELCGGTHVNRLGDIGLFAIVSESAVSSGVRRIEALTGEAARQYYVDQQSLLKQSAATLKTAPADLVDRIENLQKERKTLERDLIEAKKQLALGGGGVSGPAVQDIAGIKFMGQVLPGVAPKDLRGMVDDAKKSIGSGVIAFVATNEGKAALVVGVTDDMTESQSAVDLIRAAVPKVGGKGGGGRADMAQAGGPDASGAEAAIDAIQALLAK